MKNIFQFSRRDFLKFSGISMGATALTGQNLYAQNEMILKEQQKICIFSKHLQWLDYDGMAKTAANIGFDGIDLTVRPRGHVLPGNVETDLPRAVEAVKKAGLEVPMITTNIQDADDPLTEKILKTASKLGIQYYRMGWYDYDPKLEIQQNLDNFVSRLKALAAVNEHHQIKGAYQNHSGTGFGAPVWDIWLTLKEVNSKWLGCQFDIRHAVVENGHTWPITLKALGSYINTLDIKDFIWKKDEKTWQTENVPLGEGMVDFNEYFKLIKSYNIRAPICLHLEYPLGGAEHGNTSLTVDPQVVITAMKKDLTFLKDLL
ncbi:TIM barrel protein [candidate division KSB1 bacterium]|nr:TIM barrel protein [candidate division KSB1 bacterium]